MNRSNLPKLFVKIAMLAVVAGVVLCALLFAKKITSTGTLQINVTPSGATVLVDGKRVQGTKIHVKPGKHTVVAQKTGYLQKQSDTTVNSRQTSVVNIFLAQVSLKNYVVKAITDSGIYAGTGITDQFYVSKIKEFYGGLWIIATVQIRGTSDLAIVVIKHDLANQNYTLYLGPTPQPDASLVAQSPPDIQNSLSHDAWLEQPPCCSDGP